MDVPRNVRTLDAKPACSDRLDLVDASYERSGAVSTQELRWLCENVCPVAEDCLDLAMRSKKYEQGVWGGTSQKQRTGAGATPHPLTTYKQRKNNKEKNNG